MLATDVLKCYQKSFVIKTRLFTDLPYTQKSLGDTESNRWLPAFRADNFTVELSNERLSNYD